MATEQVVAHAMYQKYVNAVPLYRQETDWAQYGLPLSRGRLARWIQICLEDYFLPVYVSMHLDSLDHLKMPQCRSDCLFFL